MRFEVAVHGQWFGAVLAGAVGKGGILPYGGRPPVTNVAPRLCEGLLLSVLWPHLPRCAVCRTFTRQLPMWHLKWGGS